MFKKIVPIPMQMALLEANSDLKESAYHLLSFLSEFFEINLTEVNQCYKFEESDVFIYF